MKKSGITSLALAALMLMFTACQKDDSDQIGTGLDALELESDASLETTYEQVDQTVEIGFALADANLRTDENELGSCAVVTHDQENKTITIDFGDGCVGRHGNTLAGQIVVVYTDRLYVPGAKRTITFVDFYFNDISVEGTRTIENTTATDTERQFTVTLENGKLDFGDGTFVTREAEWTRTWYISQGMVKKSGGASGININGFDYSVTVEPANAITFLRECSMGIPVSGIKTIVVGDNTASIDFGDGTCDRLVIVTMNGESTEREIHPRRGRRDRQGS